MENGKSPGVAANSSGIRFTLAGVILFIGLALSIFAFITTQRWETSEIANEFERLVGGQISVPQSVIDLYVESSQSMGAHIGATGVIRQDEFRQYAQEMRNRRPGIRNSAWIPRVFDSDQQAHILSMRAQGITDYEFTSCGETDADQQTTLSGEIYYPITYMEPMLRPTLGFCMGSNSAWQQAMDKARDTGLPVASESLFAHGWQELDEHPADLQFEVGVFQPVYHFGLPSELGARRANLRGFLFNVLQTDMIVEEALRDLRDKGIDVTLTVGETPPVDDTALRLVAPFSMAGKSWSVIMRPEASFIEARTSAEPWIVLGVGTLLTLLLVSYLLMLMGRTAKVEQLVRIAQAELKESESQLIQSEKMASIGQMVAGMVHEINTPLGYVKSSVSLVKDNLEQIFQAIGTQREALGQLAIAGNGDDSLESIGNRLQELEEEGTNEETQVLINNTLDGLAQISRLVTNLKDFSRLDREKMAEVDIHKGLEDTLMMVHHLTKKDIQIVKHYGENLPPITCSPAQINQVFLNLMVNGVHAIHAAREGGGTLTLGTTSDGKFLHVEIADDGMGIASDKVAKIFEPFFTTKKSGKGTGLGLAIAKKIIDEHKGRIDVESTPGEGTRFRISLPIRT